MSIPLGIYIVLSITIYMCKHIVVRGTQLIALWLVAFRQFAIVEFWHGK